jgi:glycosyltransferase involved in cell wall biosynthesis
MSDRNSHNLDILIACHEAPSRYCPGSFRVFELIKRAKIHGLHITFFSYSAEHQDDRYLEEIKKQCDSVTVIDKPLNEKGKIINTIKDTLLSPELAGKYILPTFFYSREMRDRIRDALSNKRFDAIYCSLSMIYYVLNVDLPKVLEIQDPVLYSSYQHYLNETNPMKKIWRLLRHYQHKIIEAPLYRNFDACVFVSPIHRDSLKPYLPEKSIAIPFGIDTEYFSEALENEQALILVFIGDMSYFHNVTAMSFFYSEVFPLIRKKVQETKLYIVGCNPSAEILKLASDAAVIVTGLVEDIRPYYSMATLVIVPMVTDDGGFKTKILEAMAMAKCIVSTSLGAKGLDVTPDQDIVIADQPGKFAESVVALFNDRPLRRKIGSNARKLVKEKYSWEMMTERLIGVIKELVRHDQ